ncbi:MAG: hypothetical protein J6Y43_03120 [Clostridia bacterium]|nr:hypothetical protein [Clostridia bacterium]
MKKIIVIILAMLLAVMGFSGCSLINEKETRVDFSYNDQIVVTKTVSIFTNKLTPSESAAGIVVPEGYKFLGWSTDKDWTFDKAEINPLVKNVVHYNDIKDHVINGRATMYAIIYDKTLIPRADIVIGWYSKTSTSGLKADMIENVERVFFNYLSENAGLIADYLEETGKTVETLDIVYRAYDGDVASMGSAINADGDVDVVIGVGNNINTTGGVPIKEKTNKKIDDTDIIMGGKVRYIARLTDRQPATVFYAWARTNDAAACWA